MEITYKGVTHDHKKWARLRGITESTLRWRIAHWGVNRALAENKVEPQALAKRPRRKSRKITDTEKALMSAAYIEGKSEDVIASLLGRSRGAVSKVLVARGLKIKGTSTKRVVVVDDETLTNGAHIHIHIHSNK